MRKQYSALFSAVVAAVGFVAVEAGAQTYAEQASGGFGSATLPPNAQEYFISTFGGGTTYYYDIGSRVIANADMTATTSDTALTTITMRLWSGTDADLFKIRITDPANFSASIVSATNILALFSSDGTAIAASRGGGAANAITGAQFPLTAGEYFIGESQASGTFGGSTFGVPRNNANSPLFDFSTDGVKLPAVQVDMKLATDPFIAWTINNGSFLIGNSTFTSPGSTITLAGAKAIFIPEPATAAALGSLGLAGGIALRRRRR